MTSLEDLAQLKALRPQQRDGGDADERLAALLSAYADRLESALGAALVRVNEAEGLLREVFEEFGPGCRDFSTWDTVEHFLDHPEQANAGGEDLCESEANRPPCLRCGKPMIVAHAFTCGPGGGFVTLPAYCGSTPCRIERDTEAIASAVERGIIDG